MTHETNSFITQDLLPKTPNAVLIHSHMNIFEKRGLLASWASDVHAIPNAPHLRQLEDGSILELEEILLALKALDTRDEAPSGKGRRSWRLAFNRRLPLELRNGRRTVRRNDEDDDPPP